MQKYLGLIIEGGKSGLTEKKKSSRVTGTFDEVTFWNYDRTPSEADPWQQSLQWSKVAEILHKD